ncbi:DinB family protein [Paraflavitalea pollutisoli]|uniref:DinB family protein n=1 Tax=Paraflavitalea pollutisoli TaxID=3034143 RepID=UPI0023EAB966|nr:DinB family protein [Paraflavitalea sp. H1-2-19X]
MQTTAIATTVFITPDQLLQHWQGHRSLTRKAIEAFPEQELFNYSIGGMRPFSALALELATLSILGVHGAVTGTWKQLEEIYPDNTNPTTKEGLLQLWDDATDYLNVFWPQIPEDRWQETTRILGQYEGTFYSAILYWLDNENHHRGQGFVYLRSLGIQPPFFWDRGQSW